MEDSYRNNLIDFSIIYLNKEFDWSDSNQNEFQPEEFTYFIFKQLFNVDINTQGYGLDNSTKQLTNNIGDLKIYNEHDSKKLNYLNDIKSGDLVFFHTQSLTDTSPTPTNRYPGHVGIYLGNNEFIHVGNNEEKIVIDKLEDKWLNWLVASRDIVKEIINKDFFNNT